jgi:hypothetical protein
MVTMCKSVVCHYSEDDSIILAPAKNSILVSAKIDKKVLSNILWSSKPSRASVGFNLIFLKFGFSHF